ncbi:MAG TPA: protein kinase [Thermoanaerobaculia bacterium]|nr:protein kinase [Thermoanaerobaculia bacterium]
MALSPGSRLGPYEILAPLGAGGMGEVYRARDPRLGREVAIKVLPAEVASDSERLHRFEKEARAASALNHPNIVTIHDIGREGSVSYIAMEFVEGSTVRDLLAGGSLPTRRLLAVAAQTAEGLARAHEAGIVHRDLKPENLMITRDGFVKILDFGLAKLTGPPEGSGGATRAPTISAGTEPGVVMGTVAYMSPEQAAGGMVDFRSDQFSLGSILYEMAAGKKPFAGETRPEVMAAIIRQEPEPLASVAPKMPTAARWIVERCLAKDPSERYVSTRDLARDLTTLRDRISEAAVATDTEVARVGRSSSGARTTLFAGVAAAAALAAGILLAPLVRPSAGAALPSWTQISFRRGMIWSGRFAPDGQTAVYSAAWEGEPVRLYATRAGTAETRALDLPSGKILGVSRTGELAFLRDPRFVFFYLQPGTLARVALDGSSSARDLLEDVHGADWSPDGGRLAVARGAKGKGRLEYPIGKVLYETEGVLGSLGVSPDGEWIAFFEYVVPEAFVVAIRTADGQRRVLSRGWSLPSGGLAWSADGREVWFTARKRFDSPSRLQAVTLAGRQREVTRVPGDLRLLDIGRDGRALVARWDWQTGLRAGGTTVASERELGWFDHCFLNDLSSDGAAVLFSDRGDSLFLRKTGGSSALRLGEGFAFEGSKLSPDGKWVVTRPVAEQAALVLLPTGAGEVRKIEPPASSASWLPDGRSLLLTLRPQNSKAGLAVYDIAAAAARPVPLPAGFEGNIKDQAVSRDGRRIAAVDSAGKIWLMAVDGAEARRIPGEFRGLTLIGWTQDGGHLFFYRIGDVPGRVIRLDIESGTTEPWKELRPEDLAGVVRIHPVCVTPDGRSWAYTYARVLSNLYLVEGLK